MSVGDVRVPKEAPSQPKARPFNRKKREERTAEAAAQVFAPPPPAPSPSRSASEGRSIGMYSNGDEDPVEIQSINIFRLSEDEQRLTLEQNGLMLTDDEWNGINEAALSDYDNRFSVMNLALARLAIAKNHLDAFRLAVPHIQEKDKKELKASLSQFVRML
jgi:hypothetical protein